MIARKIGIIDAALIRHLEDMRKYAARTLMVIKGSYYPDLIPIDHIAEFLRSLALVDGVILDPDASIEEFNHNHLQGDMRNSLLITALPDEELRRYAEKRIMERTGIEDELQEPSRISSKLLDWAKLESLNLKINGKLKIGLVSGSFDLIHLGHVRLINTAKSLCDVLVVATMSTSSIRKQDKNVHGDRPIYSQEDRVTVLSALRSTDHIVIFDELDCKEVIRSLKPDIYFKHQKDMERTVVREECGLVRTLGGKVIITTESAGYSSTDIINHMRGLAGK
jgi:rfaE bifunctional protein nucleotidyltransferase chain/domain